MNTLKSDDVLNALLVTVKVIETDDINHYDIDGIFFVLEGLVCKYETLKDKEEEEKRRLAEFANEAIPNTLKKAGEKL